jgi:hypothetical protein
MVLPGGQQIEALIGCRPGIVAFERPPGRFGGRHIVEDLDPNDPARQRQALGRDILLTSVIADGDAHCELRGSIETRRPFVQPLRRPWQRIINKELG